jgi:hypothetical protein
MRVAYCLQIRQIRWKNKLLYRRDGVLLERVFLDLLIEPSDLLLQLLDVL